MVLSTLVAISSTPQFFSLGDEYLPQLLMAYRSSKHASTKVTPNKMMLGREITLPVQAFISEPEKDNREISTTE
jgi:hypothetical protein